MSKQEKFITERIQNNKPVRHNYKQGTAVYYEGLDGEIKQSTVGSVGPETTMLNNGDWCYNWQIVAVDEIPQPARL